MILKVWPHVSVRLEYHAAWRAIWTSDCLSTINDLDVFLHVFLDVLQPPSPVCELIHPLSSGPLRLTETFGAVSSISEGVAESDKVARKRYITSVDVTLAVKLPVSLTRDPLAALKAEHGEPISPFEIGFIAAVHVIPSINNRDTNVTQKSSR
jgi:hypothetical protein